VKVEKDKKESFPVFLDGETVNGKVNIRYMAVMATGWRKNAKCVVLIWQHFDIIKKRST
jgi:hypothetical protein